MVAAEVTVIDDPRPWRQRVTALRPFFLVLVFAAVSFIGIRNAALEGDIKGSFTAEALTCGLGIGGRALTMLGVVPGVGKTSLSWPLHLPGRLLAERNHDGDALGNRRRTPGTHDPAGRRAPRSAWYCWQCRRPPVTFGILWIAVGLALVSNVLLPTGIVLAERTLFLATIGLAIVGGDVLWSAGRSTIYMRGISRDGSLAVCVPSWPCLAMGASRGQRVAPAGLA